MKRKAPKTSGGAKVVFLSDVDNTLLDNDRVIADLIHNERELTDVEARYPAAHYVMVDDKLVQPPACALQARMQNARFIGGARASRHHFASPSAHQRPRQNVLVSLG